MTSLFSVGHKDDVNPTWLKLQDNMTQTQGDLFRGFGFGYSPNQFRDFSDARTIAQTAARKTLSDRGS